MAIVSGQDSNLTSCRFAFESSLGVLPGTPDWILAEPNTEPDFGGDITTMERNPISADRQSLKGSVVDIEAGVSISQDFTVQNQALLLQAYMFANFSGLVEFGGGGQVLTITATTFTAAAGLTVFQVDDLVILEEAGAPSNNGVVARVTAVVAGTLTMAGAAFTAEATPPSRTRITKVGIQCASADINVVISGVYASYTSTATNFTTRLSLTPGQSVYVGGDVVAEQFTNAANNGAKRVLSIAAANLQVDKSHLDMIAETGTGKTIRFYTTMGLKNQQGILLVRKSVQWERTLGAPDDAQPTQIQSEYVTGGIASEYSMDVQPASKITSTMTFMGQNHETRTGVIGVKSGNRPTLPDTDAVNTSSDLRRIRVAQVSATDEAPDPLWALTENITLNINNNIGRDLALGTVGAARFTTGRFSVTGSMNPYFADIAVLAAAKANANVTADMFVASGNLGFALDMPLMTLSKARAVVEQDEAIRVPCDFVAHSGAKINPALDHTLMWTFFKYLPLLAQSQP